jgi:regulatory protein
MPADADDEDLRARSAEAYRKGLGLLVRREQSRRDLTRKLAARGIEQDDAQQAVEQLAERGYQDDDRFGVSFARDRAAAGYGPLRIRQELAGHGLDRDQCEAALAACEADWAERAAAQVARRCPPDRLADPARRRKMLDFLLRRGFDMGQAHAAIRAGSRSGGVD